MSTKAVETEEFMVPVKLFNNLRQLTLSLLDPMHFNVCLLRTTSFDLADFSLGLSDEPKTVIRSRFK